MKKFSKSLFLSVGCCVLLLSILFFLLFSYSFFNKTTYAEEIITDTTESTTDDTQNITYTINYLDTNEDNTPLETNNPATINSQDLPVVLENPADKLGYEFSYWGYNSVSILEIDNDGNFLITKEDLESIDADGDNIVNIYAYWDTVEYKLNFAYNVDGVIPPTNYGYDDATYNIEDVIDLTLAGNQPQKRGYNFEGWFSDADFSQPITQISGSTGELTIYGQFTKMDLVISFANGEFEDIEFDYGASAYDHDNIKGVLEGLTPTREGYTFDGWYTDASLSESSRVGLYYTFGDTSVMLYAKWTENPSPIWWWLIGCFGIVTIGGFGLWVWLARPKTKQY